MAQKHFTGYVWQQLFCDGESAGGRDQCKFFPALPRCHLNHWTSKRLLTAQTLPERDGSKHASMHANIHMAINIIGSTKIITAPVPAP